MSVPSGNHWNIFVRELDAILVAHGLRLGKLDDLGVVEYAQIVSRLQQSTKSPRHLHVLNPDALERLFALVPLSDAERERIRAALLATAVERLLMDRIDRPTALMAADDVFHILLAAMRAHPQSAMATRIKEATLLWEEINPTGDEAFELALDVLDRAMLDLHAARAAVDPAARRLAARQAAEGFRAALKQLDRAQVPPPESDEWRAWHQEAVRGRNLARARGRRTEGASRETASTAGGDQRLRSHGFARVVHRRRAGHAGSRPLPRQP